MPTRYTVVVPDRGGGGGAAGGDGAHPRMVTVMGGIPPSSTSASTLPPPPPPPAQPHTRVSSDGKRNRSSPQQQQQQQQQQLASSPPPPPAAASGRFGSPSPVRRPRKRESGIGGSDSSTDGGASSSKSRRGRTTAPPTTEQPARRRRAPKVLTRAQVQQLQRTLRQEMEEQGQWLADTEGKTAEKQRLALESMRKIVASTLGSAEQRLYVFVPFLQRSVLSPLLLQLTVPPPPPPPMSPSPSPTPTFVNADEDLTPSIAHVMAETWDTLEGLLAFYQDTTRRFFMAEKNDTTGQQQQQQQHYRTTLMMLLAVLAEGTQLLQLLNGKRGAAKPLRFPSPQQRRDGTTNRSPSRAYHRMMEDMVNPVRAAKSIRLLGGDIPVEATSFPNNNNNKHTSLSTSLSSEGMQLSGHSLASSDHFFNKSQHSDASRSDDEVSIDSRLLRLMVDRASPVQKTRRQVAPRRGSHGSSVAAASTSSSVVMPARNAFSHRSTIAAMKLQKKFLKRNFAPVHKETTAPPTTPTTAALATTEPPDEAAGGPRHVLAMERQESLQEDDDDTATTTKAAGNSSKHPLPAKGGHGSTRVILDPTDGEPKTNKNHQQEEDPQRYPQRYKAALQEWNPSARLLLQDLRLQAASQQKVLSVLVTDLFAFVTTTAEKTQDKEHNDDDDEEEEEDNLDEDAGDMDELTATVRRMLREDIPQLIYHPPKTGPKGTENSVTNTLAAFVQYRTAIRHVKSFFAARFPSEVEEEEDHDDDDNDDEVDGNHAEIWGEEEKAIMAAAGIATQEQMAKASTSTVIRRAMHTHGPLLLVLAIIPMVPQWNAARRRRFWNSVRRYGVPTAVSMLVAAAVVVAARGVQKWKRQRRPYEMQQNGHATAATELHVPPTLPTPCHPRTTLMNQILDWVTQSTNTSTVLYGIRGSGKTTLASMAMRSITVGKRFYDGIVWLCLGDNNNRNHNANCSKTNRASPPQQLSYPQVVNLYRQLCYQLATTATPSSSDVDDLQEAAWQLIADIYYLGEDEDGNLLEPLDENDFRDHCNDTETKRASLIMALQQRLQAGLQLSSRSILIVLDGLESLSDLQWFQFTHQASQCHTLATFSTTTSTMEKNPLGPSSSLVCVEAFSTEETMNAISMETDMVDNDDLCQIAAELAQVTTVTPLTVQWFLRFTCIPSVAPLKWCQGRRREMETYMTNNNNNAANKNDDFVTFCYATLRASYQEAADTGGQCQASLFLFAALMGAVLSSSSASGGGGRKSGNNDSQPDTATRLTNAHDTFCSDGIPEFALTSFWNQVKTVLPPNVAALLTTTTTAATTTRTMKRRKQTVTENGVSAMTQQLVQAGLLVPLVPGNQTCPIFTVRHSILAEAGLRLLSDLPWKLSPRVDKRKYFKLCLLRSYSSFADSSQAAPTWAVSNLQSVDLAKEALDLMASPSFVRERFSSMGVLRGTHQHIRDAEELHRQLGPIDGEILSSSSRHSHSNEKSPRSAPIRVIASYQCIANVLTSMMESDDSVDPCEAVVGILQLGHSLARQGWFNEAAFMYNECLEQAQSVQAMLPDSGKVLGRVLARSLTCLATIQRHKGDSIEAIKLYNEALGYMTTNEENARLLETTAIHVHEGLGDCYREEGEFYLAIQSYSKASIALEKASPPRSSLRASVLHRIGLACRGKGHWGGSKKCFSEELDLRRSQPGSGHSPAFAEALLCVGVARCQLGEPQDAIANLTESVEVWKRLIAVEKRYLLRYASSLQELGQAHRQNGSLADALVAYKEALAVREAILGQNHADTAQTLHSIGVVYCDLGEQEEAMRAYALSLNMRTGDDGEKEDADDDSIGRFRTALVNTQSLHLKPPSVRRIRQACRILFGEDILPLPCYTARLFACIALMVDRMRDESDDASTNSGGSGQRSEHGSIHNLVNWIGPLKPLLFAMVNAEAITLHTDEDRGSQSGEPKRQRKIQFASHDFATVPPPVDMVLGSNSRLETTIDRLLAVMEEQDRMERDNTDFINGSFKELPKVLLVLNAMTADREGAALREACAEAMVNSDMASPLAFPQRFLTIAAIYRKEFEVIYEVIGSQASVLRADVFRSSPLRGQLSRLIESSIKYHIRRLFDPVPMGYTIPSREHPARDFSACRARTDELLCLCPPDEGSRRGLPSQLPPTGNDASPVVELTPLWERPLSHVFLLALHQVHAFLQCRAQVRDSLTLDGSGLSLTAVSDAYHRFAIPQDMESSGRFEPASSLPLTDAELGDLVADVHLACTCLSALRGADFLMAVLQWPGVDECIQEAGGWDRVEFLADAVAKHEMDGAFPDMGHLQLLRNMQELQETITTHRVEMVTAASAGQVVIQNLWRRFQRKGVLKRRVVGKQQGMQLRANDEFLAHALLDASCTCLFPCLVAPSNLWNNGI